MLCKDVRVGRGGVLLALQQPLAPEEREALKQRLEILVADGCGGEGERGRCHLSLMVQTVMDMRGGKDAAAQVHERAGPITQPQRVQEIIGLADFSPKLFWWTCSEVVEMITCLRGMDGRNEQVDEQVVPWRERVCLPAKAPRGDAASVLRRAAQRDAVALARDGSWRACPRCGWARYVPTSGAAQWHCKGYNAGLWGPWRCGAQLRTGSWNTCSLLGSADESKRHNVKVQELVRQLQAETAKPTSKPERESFLCTLREKVAEQLTPA